MKQTSANIIASKEPNKLEAALNNPAYQNERQLIEFLLEKKGENLFPTKDLAEQKRLCQAKMKKLAEQHPDLLLKDALSLILKDLPSSFPASQLQPLTNFLIKYWMKAGQQPLVGA
ncbi:MAG: hypothetical protein IT258_22575 [Saprospiraceae bacterium]|nr:hypothetical protein [Saprospiraceae bacterium]